MQEDDKQPSGPSHGQSGHGHLAALDPSGPPLQRRPAMKIPCSLVSGLPVGMLLVGRHLDEHTVLRVAHQDQAKIYPCPVPPTRLGQAGSPQGGTQG
jgi:hypothetical protein